MAAPQVCLIGCGGMGRRHLAGYAALADAGLFDATLAGVLDVRPEAAEAVAAEAEALLGHRPVVYDRLEDVVDDPAITAADVVTDPSSHHVIAAPLLRSGRHVLSEKPLGLTVRAARTMVDAAREGNAILATAENYRRGGQNRLARAVLDAGLLGRVHLLVQLMVGGSDQVLITPWRHRKEAGSIALDMGCHLTDLIEYYLGPIETAYGRGFIAEPVRRAASGEVIEATGEDSLVGSYRTVAGVDVQLAYVPSGPGHSYVQRTVHGSAGSMVIPPDRSAGLVEVRRADGVLGAAALREAVTATLDPVTVALLGPDGTGDGRPFAEVDAGYLGIEIADFLGAIRDGRPPEVDGAGGVRAVAGVLALMESDLAGRAVHIDEIIDGSVSAYQDELDAALGLLTPAGSAQGRA